MIFKRISLYCQQKGISTEKFLSNYEYKQEVQTKTKKQEVSLVKADAFFLVLKSLCIYLG